MLWAEAMLGSTAEDSDPDGVETSTDAWVARVSLDIANVSNCFYAQREKKKQMGQEAEQAM